MKEIEEMARRAKEMNREILTDFTLLTCLARPKSAGSIRLKSKNYTEHPQIDPQYLSDERDVKTLVKGTKMLDNSNTNFIVLTYNLMILYKVMQ